MDNPLEDVAAAVHDAITEQRELVELPFALTPVAAQRSQVQTDLFSMSCTSMDHVYPTTKTGARCYCGARTWGQA